MLGLTVPKIDTVRVGFIGLGGRGRGAVSRFIHIPGVRSLRCATSMRIGLKTQVILDNAGLRERLSTVEMRRSGRLCERDDIDLVYVVTDWKWHATMMVYAMEQGNTRYPRCRGDDPR